MRDKIKRFVALFLCIAVAFGSYANVSADSDVLKFTSIEITGKSETSTVETPSISSEGQIQGGVIFGAQGDFVDYRIVIENSDDYSYRIDSVDNNNSIDSLSVTYMHDDAIEAKTSSNLLVHLEYVDMLVNTEPIDISDLQIALRLTRISGSNEERQEISPNTSDGIMSYSFGSGVALLAAMAFLRRIASRRIRIMGVGTALVLLGASTSLYVARAENFEELNAIFANVHLDSTYEEYSVLIDTGNGPVSQQVTYGVKFSDILTRPTKAGYHFDKWADASGNPVDENGIVTGPITVRANMEPNQYNVVFHINDGTDTTTSQTLTYDSSANLNSIASSRPGYTLAGWATRVDGDAVYTDGQNVKNLTETTNDVDLYAVWTKRTDIDYVVRHKYENLTDDGFTNDDEAFHNGSVDTDISPAIKHVDGFVDPAQKTEQINADGSSIIEYEYLRERVQLTLDDEDNIESGSSAEDEYKYGYPISLTAKELTGCNFTGWYKGEEKVSSDRVYEFNITSSIALRPTYEVQKFTVTIDRGDGSVVHDNIEYGTLLSTLLGDEPSKTGYVFTGWTNNEESVDGLTAITSAMDVVANFEPNKYLVVFHANDGTEVINSQQMTYDKSADLNANSFERPGYNFAGWAISASGEAIYADGQNVKNLRTTTDDFDLYAIWTKKTNIHYTVLHRYQKALNPDEYDEAVPQDHYGSVDTEYNTDSILEERAGFINPTNRTYTIEATGSTQIVLEYSRETFGLSLSNQEFIDETSTPAGSYRYEYPITLKAKARTGWDFAGWYSGDTRKSTNTTYEFNIAEETTLEPRYQIQTYTVTIDKADGSAPAEYNIEYGTPLAEYLVEPQVTGYHFVEWTDSDSQVVTNETLVEGPMAITANIARNVYHVVFNANGGTGEMANQEFTYGISQDLTENSFTRDGYNFAGWATSADGEMAYGDKATITTSLTDTTNDVPLYAKWGLRSDIPYTVKHRYENVETGFTEVETPAFGSVDTDITPETAPLTGFQDPVVDGNSTPIPGQIDAKGGTIFIYNYYRLHKQLALDSAEYIDTDTPTGSYKYGATITVTALDRLKYEFAGWSKDGGATIISTDVTYSFEITEDTTLTPVYEEIPFYYVFKHDGACQIKGGAAVEGDDCGLHPELGYIDTGVKLYDEASYNEDFEIGFTIDSLATEQVNQATFVNAKFENSNSSAIGTGLVVRKGGQQPLEVTHAVNGRKDYKQYNVGAGTTVKIIRFNGVIYYSINGGALITLQSMRNTNDYKDTVTWFGASYDSYTDSPWRYLDGTLSNMYIKKGVYDGDTVTVTLDANGGTVDPESFTLLAGKTLSTSGYSELPSPTGNGSLFFIDWYLDKDVWGQRATENTVFDSDTTIYARWETSSHVCAVMLDEIVYKDKLQDCIDEVPANTAEPVEIAVLLNVNPATMNIPSSKKVILDGRGHNLKSDGSTPIVRNHGTLYLVDLELIGIASQSTVNNGTTEAPCTTATCHLYVDNSTISTSGTKQALWNKGGYVEIYGGSNIYSTINKQPLHNLDGGEMRVIDATVEARSGDYPAIQNDGTSTLIIGTSGDGVRADTPVITSVNGSAISTTNPIEFYDGILTAKKHAINRSGALNAASISNSPEPGYNFVVTNDGNTNQTTTLYYGSSNGS